MAEDSIERNCNNAGTGSKKIFTIIIAGDEDEKMLDRYLKRGDLFALYKGDLKATVVVTQEKEDVFEVKTWRYGRRNNVVVMDVFNDRNVPLV